MIKPKIIFDSFVDAWICQFPCDEEWKDDGPLGIGDTPMAAYGHWEAQQP